MTIQLSHDQAQALKKIINWYKTPDKQYVTLGGYAGTGKTTLIAILKTSLSKLFDEEKKKVNIAFCSYTGRATQNLKTKLKEQKVLKASDTVSTIHGLIYDPIENISGVIIGWTKKDAITADLIIIDEASMINKEIWLDLISFNVPIIAVGDHGQLPPIEGSFNLMQDPEIKLENIHRQAAENPIIKVSINARTTGEIEAKRYSSTVIKYSQQDYDYSDANQELLESYTSDMLILCGYNSTRVKINQFVRNALGFELPIPQIRDRVICLRNNHSKDIYNGMLGTIKSISGNSSDFYEAEIYMDDIDKPYVGKIYAPQFNSTEPINFTKDRLKIGKADLFE